MKQKSILRLAAMANQETFIIPKREPPVAVQRLVRRFERLSKIADEKVAAIGGWTTRLPSGRGLWFHAVWQKAGYFHVQRYPLDSLVRYLRHQAKTVWPGSRQQWCGPFTAEQANEQWTWHVNPPNDKLTA